MASPHETLDELESEGIDVMETRSNEKLTFGHSLTHEMADDPVMDRGGRSDEQLEDEHDALAELMEDRGLEHNSPLDL